MERRAAREDRGDSVQLVRTLQLDMSEAAVCATTRTAGPLSWSAALLSVPRVSPMFFNSANEMLPTLIRRAPIMGVA